MQLNSESYVKDKKQIIRNFIFFNVKGFFRVNNSSFFINKNYILQKRCWGGEHETFKDAYECTAQKRLGTTDLRFLFKIVNIFY